MCVNHYEAKTRLVQKNFWSSKVLDLASSSLFVYCVLSSSYIHVYYAIYAACCSGRLYDMLFESVFAALSCRRLGKAGRVAYMCCVCSQGKKNLWGEYNIKIRRRRRRRAAKRTIRRRHRCGAQATNTAEKERTC